MDSEEAAGSILVQGQALPFLLGGMGGSGSSSHPVPGPTPIPLQSQWGRREAA